MFEEIEKNVATSYRFAMEKKNISENTVLHLYN